MHVLIGLVLNVMHTFSSWFASDASLSISSQDENTCLAGSREDMVGWELQQGSGQYRQTGNYRGQGLGADAKSYN